MTDYDEYVKKATMALRDYEPCPDLRAWVEVACEVADAIRHSGHVTVYASFTDPDGQYGEPRVYTEWGIRDGAEVAVLREWRYPSPVAGEPDRKPCRHTVPTRKEADRDR